MKVWMSPYSLAPIKISSGVQYSNSGILLKFEDEEYSLYHPIETLKDQPLKTFISNMSIENPVFTRVRESAVSLKSFEPYLNKKIECYYSCPSFEVLFEKTSDIKNAGFKTVKLKVSSIKEIKIYCGELMELPFKFIFDFNGRDKAESFENIEENLKNFFINKVLYVEDPYSEKISFPYFKLASDFNKYDGLEEYKVFKPTGFSHPINDFKVKTAVVTSYLDHPLGQMISALWAAKNFVENECGLLSHTYYEQNSYNELVSKTHLFDFSGASGLFKLLDAEDWTS